MGLIASTAQANSLLKPSYALSGGNKRKLSVAIAMIGNPPIVIPDEPSTGTKICGRQAQICDVPNSSRQVLSHPRSILNDLEACIGHAGSSAAEQRQKSAYRMRLL
ncbi:hypothetical protein SASPL_111325 [Salvia splendens]|uniref:ABC transporter domain-containing protein n=1 Tax=Salvia splendens TaxID=180675 RepID=A0A8X8YBP7_SALSN|nr:hypothetical protein SASPL_111325 [Salvia splendens]